MALQIHLLGAPQVVADGVVVPAPRGTKAWGLLAYLLLRPGPTPRAEVAGLLFPHAVDPMAALRWNLTMVRRLVGDRDAWRGDPLTWVPAVPAAVDVLALHGDPGTVPAALIDEDLLAGLMFAVLPAFDLWLQAQRRRARGAAAAWLHEAALVRLVEGDADGAAEVAARLLAAEPADDDHHALARVIAAHRRPPATGFRLTPADVEVEDAWTLLRTLAHPGPAPEAVVDAMTGLARTEIMRARYGRAEHWLARAVAATDDPVRQATLLMMRATARTDVADYPVALAHLEEAARMLRGDRRRAHAVAMTGRALLLRGDLDGAAAALDEALADGHHPGSEPLPGTAALRAEVDLRRGATAAARSRLERALPPYGRSGEPGRDGLPARGLGLVLAAQGNVTGAVTTLKDAVRRAGRGPGRWRWAQAWILEALAGTGVRQGLEPATVWTSDLAARSARGGMAELVVRATLLQGLLGEPAAPRAARGLAVGIENPDLERLLETS